MGRYSGSITSGGAVASDVAYDATTWNASLDPPTKNAVRDKIEDILDGVTFTGDVVVPDEAYNATTWNGSLEVPTKNAVRDKIETLGSGSRRMGFAWTPSSSIIAENLPAWGAAANAGALTSGRVLLVPIWLEAGDVITSITFVSATTAAGSPTNQWFALCDDDCVALRLTADDTTTAWAATAAKTLTLTSTYTISTSGNYRLAVMVAATTVPTLRAASLNTGMPTRVINGNTGLTTPPAEATDLNGITSASSLNLAYAYVS